MPTLKRQCGSPGCGTMAVTGSTYCAPHKQRAMARKAEADKRRPSAARRGYDNDWRRVRGAYIKAHPYCEVEGCRERTDEVDHITPIADGGARLSWSNLSAKCRTHHARKSINENRGPDGKIKARW